MPFHPLLLILAVPVVVIVAATTGSTPTPPDLTGIAAIITACVGVIGFLATLVRGRANNGRVEKVEQAASYVKGFEALITNLEGEIAELQENIDHATTEREAMRGEFEEKLRSVQSELGDKSVQVELANAELIELRGQIRGFLTAEQWQEFQQHLP